MAKQIINIGASANDGSGDPLRNAFDKANDNFNELYFALGGNTPISLFDANGNLDIPSKANKISAFYSTEALLLDTSASVYKGCVGFAQNTGYLYYSDGTDWIKIAKFDELATATASDSFASISISGQPTVTADSSTDTLTLVAGANVTLTTDPVSDSITIAANAGSGGGGTDLNSLNVGDINVAGDSIAFIDADDSASKKESVVDFVAAIAGTGLTAAAGQLSVSGGSYADSDVDTHLNTSTASSGEVLSWTGSDYDWIGVGGGSGYADTDVDTHLNTSTAQTNEVLSWTGSDYAWVAQSGGGGGATRVTETETTASIADGASGNIAFGDLGKSYSLYSVQVDKACWVRIYSDTASRTADAARTQGSDPAEGAGVVAEFIATGATTFKITPAIMGYIDNSETTIPVAVKNNSGATGTVAVTITALKLES